MSLKRQLDQPDSALRGFFVDNLPQTSAARELWKRQMDGAELLVDPRAVDDHPPFSLLGHAISLRLSWLFDPSLPASVEAGVRLAVTWFGLAPEVAGEFLDRCGRVAETPDHDQEALTRLAFVAGLFDNLFRSGPVDVHPLATMGSSTCGELLASTDERWIADIDAVSDLARAQLLDVIPVERVIVGPTFAGSADVGGADGDLMVGHTYLELKASIDNKLRQRDLQQIVSYALLDYEDAYAIEKVAIYLARYGRLIRWHLDDLLLVLADAPVDLAQLRMNLRTTLRAAPEGAV